VRDIELEAAREFGTVAELLAVEGLEQERRPLRCAVRDLCVESGKSEADAGTLTLSFSLGRGQFATAVLREIAEFGDALELNAEPPALD